MIVVFLYCYRSVNPIIYGVRVIVFIIYEFERSKNNKPQNVNKILHGTDSENITLSARDVNVSIRCKCNSTNEKEGKNGSNRVHSRLRVKTVYK